MTFRGRFNPTLTFHIDNYLKNWFNRLVSFSTAVENRLIRMYMVVFVMTNIGFDHFRPLKVVLILTGVFKVDFTAWSKLTAVENHLVGKSIFGLVVTHIGFVHFRSLKVVLILIGVLKWILPPGRI